MNQWGVSPCYTNPPVAKADRRNDTNTHRNATESYPHPPNPPRQSGVTNVGPTIAIATHTTPQSHCSQDCRYIIGPCNAPGPDIATVWTCPTPVYTHTEGDAQTTHRARAIVLCARRRPTCPQCNAIGQHQAGMQPQQRKHIGDQPTRWRGHTRPTTNPKEGKRRGYSSKEFCANTDLCPLASPRVALVGVCLLRHPDKGNTR